MTWLLLWPTAWQWSPLNGWLMTGPWGGGVSMPLFQLFPVFFLFVFPPPPPSMSQRKKKRNWSQLRPSCLLSGTTTNTGPFWSRSKLLQFHFFVGGGVIGGGNRMRLTTSDALCSGFTSVWDNIDRFRGIIEKFSFCFRTEVKLCWCFFYFSFSIFFNINFVSTVSPGTTSLPTLTPTPNVDPPPRWPPLLTLTSTPNVDPHSQLCTKKRYSLPTMCRTLTLLGGGGTNTSSVSYVVFKNSRLFVLDMLC